MFLFFASKRPLIVITQSVIPNYPPQLLSPAPRPPGTLPEHQIEVASDTGPCPLGNEKLLICQSNSCAIGEST